MKQITFKEEILKTVGDETIEFVLFQQLIDSIYFNSDFPDLRDSAAVKEVLGKFITWEQAAPLLDYNYKRGYGSRDCHDIVIYTDKNIYYVHDYDGATWLQFVPRYPNNS